MSQSKIEPLPVLVYGLVSPALLGGIVSQVLAWDSWWPGEAARGHLVLTTPVTRMLIAVIFSLTWLYHYLSWKGTGRERSVSDLDPPAVLEDWRTARRQRGFRTTFLAGIDLVGALLIWVASALVGNVTTPAATAGLMAAVAVLYLIAQLYELFSSHERLQRLRSLLDFNPSGMLDQAGLAESARSLMQRLQRKRESAQLGAGVAGSSALFLFFATRSQTPVTATVLALAAIAGLYLMFTAVWWEQEDSLAGIDRP